MMSTQSLKSYFESVISQFKSYKSLGEKAMSQVPEDMISWCPGQNDNSISVIVKHMNGNMLSRWTDFLSADGEKAWRNREGEFIDDIRDRGHLLQLWEEGWKCLFDALDKLDENDLTKDVFIRNEKHSVIEAINRQLTHYAYHVGQIVYLARLIAGDQWVGLSIPRGESQQFNEKMFKNQPG